VAILLNEPGASRLVSSIERAEDRLISVATVIEASLVLLGRFGEAGELQLDALLRSIRAELVPVDAEQMAIAREAARAFGRGRHRAALNLGDCFSYAVAVSRGERLLFVGDDFTHTDVAAEHW
jgi:ribonuclease VapC